MAQPTNRRNSNTLVKRSSRARHLGLRCLGHARGSADMRRALREHAARCVGDARGVGGGPAAGAVLRGGRSPQPAGRRPRAGVPRAGRGRGAGGPGRAAGTRRAPPTAGRHRKAPVSPGTACPRSRRWRPRCTTPQGTCTPPAAAPPRRAGPAPAPPRPSTAAHAPSRPPQRTPVPLAPPPPRRHVTQQPRARQGVRADPLRVP